MRTKKFSVSEYVIELLWLIFAGIYMVCSLKDIYPYISSTDAMSWIHFGNIMLFVFACILFSISSIKLGCMSFFNMIMYEDIKK